MEVVAVCLPTLKNAAQEQPRRSSLKRAAMNFSSRIVVVVTVVAMSVVVSSIAHGQASTKVPTILFMCPHGAAKSVLASTYFKRVAKERGLNVHVTSAGTDPDAEISPAIANHLEKNGYELPITKPRRATAEDLATADVVISIGCDLKDLPAPRGTLIKWDDVPALSDEFAQADGKIRERVVLLVEELLRNQPR